MRKVIAWVFAVLLLVLAALIVIDRNVLLIKGVEVVGCPDEKRMDIVRAAGIEFGGSIRKADTSAMAKGIDATGMYRCVSIEKDYPSDIIITVDVRLPAAVAVAGGQMAVMDADGYVIRIDPGMPAESVFYVTGLEPRSWNVGSLLEAPAGRLEAMSAIINALSEIGAGEYVSEINVTDINALYIYSRTGINVQLGNSENMRSKVVWMAEALRDLEARGETSGRLNVSGGDKADFKAY